MIMMTKTVTILITTKTIRKVPTIIGTVKSVTIKNNNNSSNNTMGIMRRV